MCCDSIGKGMENAHNKGLAPGVPEDEAYETHVYTNNEINRGSLA